MGRFHLHLEQNSRQINKAVRPFNIASTVQFHVGSQISKTCQSVVRSYRNDEDVCEVLTQRMDGLYSLSGGHKDMSSLPLHRQAAEQLSRGFRNREAVNEDMWSLDIENAKQTLISLIRNESFVSTDRYRNEDDAVIALTCYDDART